MYHGVTQVEATDEHTLLLRFDNKERRVFDAKPLLGVGRFRELGALGAFKQVRVAFDTIEWANGLDLDPEYLYTQSQPLAPERDQ